MATNNGIATAQGVPFFDDKLFPAWLSNQVNLEYRDKTVIEAMTCTDHTAQLTKGGNKVTITGLPKFTSNVYVKGADTPVEHGDPSTIELLIDKARYWGFPIYDIDKKQATIPGVWEKWAKAAALDQNEKIEELFLADIVDDASTYNLGATAGKKSASYNLGTSSSPVSVTKSNIIDVFANFGGVLDEQSVPEGDWYILAPPWLIQRYMISDLGKTYVSGDPTSPMRNGYVAPFDRFKIHRCNRLPQSGSTSAVIFGKKESIIFFTQFEEAKRTPGTRDRFSEEWSGLQVYGYKVQRPEGIGVAYLSPGA